MNRFLIRAARVTGVLFLCIIVAIVSFLVGGALGLVRSVGGLEAARVESTSPTYIYSEPLGETEGSRRVIGTIFHGENRKTASLEEMPPSLLNALVAKEDERFREHPGVDILGIMRALYVDLRAGEAVEGASTITQQYVRNAYLSQDRTVARKLKEAAMAIQAERQMGKDEILGSYLNTVYFGNNAYGAAAAAGTYFDKPVEDLTVAESATLVGLLWAPSTLGTDREAAARQRDLVLERMLDNGYVTEDEYAAARETPLPEEWPLAPVLDTGLDRSSVSPEYAALVQRELVDRLGTREALRGGLSVHTTLDLEAQVAAREVLYGPAGYLAYPGNPDAALVSIEPGTGEIKALVGDRDESSQFDLVTQARRQPGSAFKTFALVAALEQGVDPTTEFVSEPKTYEVPHESGRAETWQVENFDGAHNGRISLEKALWLSDNTVFTDLVTNANGKGLENGPAAVAETARKLGVSADLGEEPHPSLVLGTEEVSPLDMAYAYATLANGGRRVEPRTIARVVRNEGRDDEAVLYTAPEPRGEQIVSPEVAAKTTEILVGDIERGIAYKAALGDQVVAGKTGTSERFFDSWFVGYTPQLATAVWMGYAEGGATLEGLLNLGGNYVGPVEPPAVIWRDYTDQALEGVPAEEFDGVDTSRYDPPPEPRPGTVPETTEVRPSVAGRGQPGSGAGPRRSGLPAGGSATVAPSPG
jgi:penicillin-binding protein 1A